MEDTSRPVQNRVSLLNSLPSALVKHRAELLGVFVNGFKNPDNLCTRQAANALAYLVQSGARGPKVEQHWSTGNNGKRVHVWVLSFAQKPVALGASTLPPPFRTGGRVADMHWDAGLLMLQTREG